MLVMVEERRRLSMEQFEADGLPPFMRVISVTEDAAVSLSYPFAQPLGAIRDNRQREENDIYGDGPPR
jgi:hypothetical protein